VQNNVEDLGQAGYSGVSDQQGDARQLVVDGIKNIQQQLSQVQSPGSHQAVISALGDLGWQNANEAKYIANWLVGKQVAASNNKIENYFKLS